MEVKELVTLFRKACIKNVWGSETYIHLLDDGSGEVVSEDDEYDGDLLFEFNTIEELIKRLEKSIQ
jgi:hypothetical protein